MPPVAGTPRGPVLQSEKTSAQSKTPSSGAKRIGGKGDTGRSGAEKGGGGMALRLAITLWAGRWQGKLSS